MCVDAADLERYDRDVHDLLYSHAETTIRMRHFTMSALAQNKRECFCTCSPACTARGELRAPLPHRPLLPGPSVVARFPAPGSFEFVPEHIPSMSDRPRFATRYARDPQPTGPGSVLVIRAVSLCRIDCPTRLLALGSAACCVSRRIPRPAGPNPDARTGIVRSPDGAPAQYDSHRTICTPRRLDRV